MSLLPAEKLQTAQWAEQHLKLPAENSDTPGDFELYYVPHLIGIFNAFDDPDIHDVYCMKSSQIAWTTALIAYVLARIDNGHRGGLMGMFSAVEAAREFSIEKLKPFVNACPKLHGKIDVSTTRKTGNSLLHKEFPGGFMKLIGSNSVRSVKSTPAPFVFVEEPDDASQNVQEQGDSVALLYERTKRIRKPKRILGGTPTIKGFSRVEQYIELTDQRVLPVECHSCGESHVLSFDFVSWLDSAQDAESHPIYGHALPETAVYGCPHCGDVWDDWQRKENIRNTCFNAHDRGDPMAGWIPTKEIQGIAGFTELGEIYSCLPGAGMAGLVEKHLKAEYYANRGDETKRISFMNNQLGRAYEFKDERPDADAFRERAKNDPDSQHNEFLCPRAGLLLTAGIDVQHSRLAIVIRAWGRSEESWQMYWGEISAESNCADKRDPVWRALDNLIFRPFEHETGATIHVTAVSIDSSDGATCDAVYEWVRSRSKQHPGVLIMAAKGASKDAGAKEIFSAPARKSIDHKNPKKNTKADNYGLKVYIVGTNKAKDLLASCMLLSGNGAGRFHYYHHEQMRSDYFDQMTAEAKIPHKKIRNLRVWQPKTGQPHEAWDCEVYALHAARAKKTNLKNPEQWAALENALLQSDMFCDVSSKEKIAARTVDQERPQRRKSKYWN